MTFTLNSSFDNSTNYIVQQKLGEPDIIPQNILLYTSSKKIQNIIKKLPKRKTPGYDLITYQYNIKKYSKKSSNIYIHVIQFSNKSWIFFDRMENDHNYFDKKTG